MEELCQRSLCLLLLFISTAMCFTCDNISSENFVTKPMTKCLFLNNTTEPLIQCDMYGIGNLNLPYINTSSATLLFRVTYSVKGPPQINGNISSLCLSIHEIKLILVDNFPENAHLYELQNDLPLVFNTITSFELTASYPPELSEFDAFTELPTSCNVNKSPISDVCKKGLEKITLVLRLRYDELAGLPEILKEFLVRRHGSVEYFRYLSTNRNSSPALLADFDYISIKMFNMTGNNLKAIFEGDKMPNSPNLTHLFISQCSISEIRPENFKKIHNLEVFDLSGNFLKKIPTGFEVLEKLKVLNVSKQRADSFTLDFEHTSSIEWLELDDLPITKLNKANFSWLPKLQYLSLQSCKIVSIEENTFHDMKYLKHLDLSNNKKLKQIFPNTFLHVAPLASVIIAYNPQIINSLSLNFNHIGILDLSNCELTSLPQLMFGMIEYLNLRKNAIVKWTNDYSFINEHYKILRLNISDNKIGTIDSEMAETLSQLQLVDIGKNKFDCKNCELNNFRRFLKENQGIIENLGTKENITCSFPTEEVDKVLIDTDYVCYTYWLTIGTPVISVMLFLSILLAALVFVYRFELIYTKQMWRMKRRNETRSIRHSVQCEFDAFVSYCKADRTWVMDKLVPTLEPPGDHYNFCLHERDFRIGTYIMDNIVDNIERSRRVLFVLSNSFLESEVGLDKTLKISVDLKTYFQWCRWELRMATHRIFERSASDFLVLLELERLQREQVPLSLRVLLATRTYLEWHQHQPEVFWSRLKQTLGKPLSRPVLQPEEPFKDVDEFLINLESLKNDQEKIDNLVNETDMSI